jgi:hypothetical protein
LPKAPIQDPYLNKKTLRPVDPYGRAALKAMKKDGTLDRLLKEAILEAATCVNQ